MYDAAAVGPGAVQLDMEPILRGRCAVAAQKGAVRASDDEVLAFVRATPGAIGYVSAGASTSGVKVITVR